MKFGVVFLSCIIVSNGIDVKFCSEPNFEGSCATKHYPSQKCGDLPFRFQWIYYIRSVRIEPSFFGVCKGKCELHSKENCGHSVTSMVLSHNPEAMPFDCERSLPELTAGMVFKNAFCYEEGILG